MRPKRIALMPSGRNLTIGRLIFVVPVLIVSCGNSRKLWRIMRRTYSSSLLMVTMFKPGLSWKQSSGNYRKNRRGGQVSLRVMVVVAPMAQGGEEGEVLVPSGNGMIPTSPPTTRMMRTRLMRGLSSRTFMTSISGGIKVVMVVVVVVVVGMYHHRRPITVQMGLVVVVVMRHRERGVMAVVIRDGSDQVVMPVVVAAPTVLISGGATVTKVAIVVVIAVGHMVLPPLLGPHGPSLFRPITRS